MSAVTLDVLGNVAFGDDFGGIRVIDKWVKACSEGKEAEVEEIDDHMLKSIKASFKSTGYNALLVVFGLGNYALHLSRKSRRTAKLLDEAAARVIHTAREKEASRNNQDKKQSLIELLFRARDSVSQTSTTKGYLSEAKLRDETKTFIVAGHEATSSWATWSLYALALYPEIKTNFIVILFLTKNATMIRPLRALPSIPWSTLTLSSEKFSGFIPQLEPF